VVEVAAVCVTQETVARVARVAAVMGVVLEVLQQTRLLEPQIVAAAVEEEGGPILLLPEMALPVARV
jgi:hypothetical protein